MFTFLFFFFFFFFFNDTATTEIYTVSDTLSLHDALPISTVTAATPGRRTAATTERDAERSRRGAGGTTRATTMARMATGSARTRNAARQPSPSPSAVASGAPAAAP